MPSERQIAANRLNSQRSTGPRTPAGKTASSRNALKTGIHAESQIIQCETPEDLEALTTEYYGEYRPSAPAERALVDSLISNEWLLRRLRRVEADIWNQGLEFIEESHFQDKRHPSGSTYTNKQETLARLQRRLDSLDRAYHRALKALHQLRADVPEQVEAPAARLQTVGPQSVLPQIGFVPSPSPDPAPAMPDLSIHASVGGLLVGP